MYVYRLENLLSLHRCGGKAANLARAARAGHAVPPSLVVECDALSLFLDQGGLTERVSRYLEESGRLDSRSLESAWRALRSEVKAAPVPSTLAEELADAMPHVAPGAAHPVVVRSSALMEDSESASFAGVFESRLGIASPGELDAGIREVWCSLWSPRALRYLRRMDRPPALADMAVLIQRQLPAEVSGLVHTADPMTGNPYRLPIHVVRGLSVDLMSGSGLGTSCVVDWETRAVLDGAQTDSDAQPRIGELLNDEAVARLIELALALDDLLGARLEIEWVMAGGELWLVQARPLTALPGYFPVDLTEAQAAQTWECPNFIIPLRKDVAVNLITPLYDHFAAMELWYRYCPEDIYFAGVNWQGTDFNGHRYALLEPDRTFIECFQDDWSRLEPWLDRNEPRYRSRWDRHESEVREIAATARDAIARTTTAAELIPVWIDVIDRVMDLISFGWSAPQSMGWMHEALLHYLMDGVRLPYERAALLAGSETSMSFRFAKALQDLVRGIDNEEVERVFREVPPDKVVRALEASGAGRAFLNEFDALCWHHAKLPISWRDRPSFWFDTPDAHLPLFLAIKETLAGRERDVVELQRAALEQRIGYQAELIARIADRDTALAARFDRIMERARVWTQALNDRHLILVCWSWEKELVWELGCRLTAEGVLKRPVDVIALRIDDLRRISALPTPSDFRQDADARVREYDRVRRLRAPPVLGKSRDREVAGSQEEEEVREGILQFEGTGMAGARTTGRARHVKDLYDPRLLESLANDEILVLPGEHAFFYADWHSIFTVVRGIVSPGRPSHHLTQVARECGMPVVGYVRGDLRRIRDGARVELDPANGRVTILKEPGL